MAYKTVVTTSWDDGDRADLKLAELLQSRGVLGTFYVPIEPYMGRPSLKNSELHALTMEGFEIGAHGVDHEHMPSLSRDQTLKVVRECKNRLEAVTGQPTRMFCYPGGHYTRTTMRCLADTGYHGARTTRMLAIRSSFRRFEMPTTVQAFPHAPMAYVRNTLKAGKPSRLINYLTGGRNGWVELGKRTFDRTMKYGGVWHLYGHSWELEDHALWQDLTELLDYVGNRKGVSYLVNGDVTDQIYPGSSSFRTTNSSEDTASSQQVPTAGR